MPPDAAQPMPESERERLGLNDVPTKFDEGFTLKTAIGALFIAMFMLPGGMYLALVAGQGVGDAAEWVTIVLFAEVARRSYAPLKKQEIYILFYMALTLTAVVNADRGLSGGPFANLIWNAYFVGSAAAKPISAQIPHWAVPGALSPAIIHRELWHPDWWRPILLLLLTDFCGRVSYLGLGYALFRLTSDVEKLPFPYAPVAASGATALSEAGSESWRWGIFSTGTVIGLLFGVVYIAVPVITSTMFGYAFQIFRIPFNDYTTNVQNILPGAIVGLSFSLGNVFLGFVLPYEIVLGSMVASVLAMVVMNPILHHFGMFPSYVSGTDALTLKFTVDMDFWLSVGIGVNLAIACIGIALVFRAFRDARRFSRERHFSLAAPPGRGDIPVFLAIAAWLGSTTVLIVTCHYLVPNFPAWLLMFFGFFWSPLNSYISARMIGLTGRGVSFPYLKEASVVATGYKQIDIWYAPVPLVDQGAVAQRFREVELTGTKMISVFKAEAMLYPVIFLASFGFWAFFWNSNPLPSGQFPYIQRFWPIQSQSAAVLQQINAAHAHGGDVNWFAKAIKPNLVGLGAVGGLLVYWACALLKIPALFYYGFAGGLGLFPANTVPQFFGAWLGRRYLAKKYGAETWARYAPVLLAGFSCGTGLIALASISFALISKAVAKLPY